VPAVQGSPSDDDLVRRALDGEADAFAALVERHRDRVYRVCLRILGDAEDAADAAQDAFVSALRKLGTFRGEARFTTWLHRVAVNACYDVLRRRARQPVLRPVDPDGEAWPDLGPPVADHADDVASGMDAAAALALVPEEFRVTLVLADVEDLPYDEIARILDVPVGTVKSRVHRGRLALARAMGLSREPRSTAAASEEEP
jgi:RNA polymerase sigma-70 factor, ECF subfamily